MQARPPQDRPAVQYLEVSSPDDGLCGPPPAGFNGVATTPRLPKTMQRFWSMLTRHLLVLALLACAPTAGAQIVDMDDGINKAGRLRMLSQRIAKAYLQVGKKVDETRSRMVLDASIAQFERHLVELKGFTPSPRMHGIYEDLERSWRAYKALLVGSEPSRENASRVLVLADDVLGLANQGVDELEKLAGTPRSRLVNLAGRQRMLSQRMAVQYQAVAWGLAPPSELDKARHEFVQALNELTHASSALPRIRAGLKLADRQWLYFETALDRYDGGSTSQGRSINVATTSEQTLEVMEQVTAHFERLPY